MDDLIFPDRVFEVGDRILAAARENPNPGSWGILLVELKSPELINHWYNGLFFWFDSKAQCLNFLLTDIHLGHRFGWDIFEYVEISVKLQIQAKTWREEGQSIEQQIEFINKLMTGCCKIQWFGQAHEIHAKNEMAVELRNWLRYNGQKRCSIEGMRSIWKS